MKKAKLMLVGIATFAILGAGLAVSAHNRFTQHTFYSSSTNGECSVTLTTLYETAAVGTTREWSTKSTTSVCPTITVTTTGQ